MAYIPILPSFVDKSERRRITMLSVPELLSGVLEKLSEEAKTSSLASKALVDCATVYSSWSYISLSLIWREMDSIQPLLTLIPSFSNLRDGSKVSCINLAEQTLVLY